MKQLRSKFLGTGMFVPQRVVTNHDLSSMMDTTDEWIVQRTGIKQRHWVEPGVGTSDLALEAAREAIRKAQIQPNEIEMIIFATLSPDHDFPGSGCFLQAKLGLPGVPALDIRQQCTGFIYAVSIADQFIRSGTYKKILVIGAEVHSTGLDRTTRGREVSVLFGDGAGAAVIGAVEVQNSHSESHILSTHLHADGRYAKELWVEAPGSVFPQRIDRGLVDEGAAFPKMNGKSVFLHASKCMPDAVVEALKANSIEIDQVDLFIFHQANLRINQMVGKQLGIPDEKIFNTIEKYANTTAATIPIGLIEAEKAGKLKKGMLVASAAFGSGFTWASMLYRW